MTTPEQLPVHADPRVTRVGAVLRRSCLDELPRPRMRPCPTGPWQVSGRTDLTRERSVRLDPRSADDGSMALDLSILFRTWRGAVKGAGAY
jgi:lipopolysaccharide/colanic/teichoic acid biosynthesis glycosyltransferase